GLALCLLIHHYLPSLLPLSALRNPQQERPAEPALADWSSGAASFSPPKSHAARARAAQEQFQASAPMHNLRLVARALDAIGGIPPLPLPATAAAATHVDEKIVLTLVAHLSARLTLIRRESLAAQTIQRAWRP